MTIYFIVNILKLFKTAANKTIFMVHTLYVSTQFDSC